MKRTISIYSDYIDVCGTQMARKDKGFLVKVTSLYIHCTLQMDGVFKTLVVSKIRVFLIKAR
jgi:hypothetical protein